MRSTSRSLAPTSARSAASVSQLTPDAEHPPALAYGSFITFLNRFASANMSTFVNT